MWSSHTALSCLYSLADILWEHRFSTAWRDKTSGKQEREHWNLRSSDPKSAESTSSDAVPGKAPLDCTWLKCCSVWLRPPPSASARSPVCSSLATWAFLEQKQIPLTTLSTAAVSLAPVAVVLVEAAGPFNWTSNILLLLSCAAFGLPD